MGAIIIQTITDVELVGADKCQCLFLSIKNGLAHGLTSDFQVFNRGGKAFYYI